MTGAAILPLLPALARLRIEVFRDFPYLYDGNLDYEQRYLRTYVTAEDAAVVVAEDGGTVVGASTCLAMRAETPNIQQPFVDAGMDIANIFYFGESVLDKAYRGRGIGVAFFAQREAQARATGHRLAAFCAVQRPEDHRLRPAGHVPLDAFWQKRGYTKRPNLTCQMSWRDIGEPAETAKTLVFWTKTVA